MMEAGVGGTQDLRQTGCYKITKQAELLTLPLNCVVHFQLQIYFLIAFSYFPFEADRKEYHNELIY